MQKNQKKERKKESTVKRERLSTVHEHILFLRHKNIRKSIQNTQTKSGISRTKTNNNN